VKSRHLDSDNHHQLLLEKLTLKQQLSLKSPVINVNNRLNGIFPFHSLNRDSEESKKSHIQKLNKLIFQVLADSKTAIVVSNVSIKNQVATLIAHIHVSNNSVIKTVIT